MSNAARKARKRAGQKFTKAQKTPQVNSVPRGMGLISGAEILAAIVIHDILGKRRTP